MRTDVPAPSDPLFQSRDGVTVTLYPTASPRELIEGAGGLTTVDLTTFAASIRHSSAEADVTLAWHTELDGAAKPRAGQMVRVAIGPYAVFTGHIDAVSGDRTSRDGSKTCNLVVRRRDATAWWRNVRRVTQIFSAGVDLAAIARNVATNLGLASTEYDLPDTGITLAHESAQLADMNAWDMLEVALQPGLRVPVVDGRGILKSADRNLLRPPDIQLPWTQIVSVEAGAARPPLATMRVTWLDPLLTRVDQQYQQLTRSPVIITVGFFNPSSRVELWWSEDRCQRADETAMHVTQNPRATFWGGIYDQSYTQTSQYGGAIHVWLDAQDAMEAIIRDILLYAAGHYLESVPVVGGFFGGAVQAAALGDILMILTQQAVGMYEVYGVPFDYVHAVNETEAYDQNAPEWRQDLDEIKNDLVPSETVAQALAVNELIYRARSAADASLRIADDLRIEEGDIIGLPDGRRFYVEDPQRDLTRGAECVLDLRGFFV